MPLFPTVRRVISSRPIRLGLALALIALGIWGVAPYLTYRISSSAFVNSEIVRVTAPMPGYLARDLPPKGKFIEQSTKLTLITTYAADRRRLVELEGELAAAKERAEVARKQIGETDRLDDELAKRMQAYRVGMRERLNYEIKEAKAERIGCLAEVAQRRDIGQRMTGLAERGTTSQIRSAEALAKMEAIAGQCEMAAVRVERLKAELKSAAKGVYLRDAANDVPYSQQQRERLFLRRQELETEARQQSARASQLAAEVAEERKRVEHLGQFDITLPADHVVWSMPATPGSVVSEGQSVLDLADCSHRFIAVELPEREFERVKPGTPASVRLIGSDKWRQGYVRQVRGSAARADDRLLAAQVPVATHGTITVEVSFAREEAAADKSYCDIGRMAEVRFQRTPPGIVTSASRLFWSIVDMFRPPEKVARQ